MPSQVSRYLPFYLGCETDNGRLIGVTQQFVLTVLENGQIKEDREFSTKLILRKLGNISDEESSELIRMGFSIGRPSGYSFSPNAFLYLLSIHVDLFGLITSGLAIDKESVSHTGKDLSSSL
jgi:hypothetical protein